MELAVENLGPDPTDRQLRRCVAFAPKAFRMELLRHLLGLPGFRPFSSRLASSDLLANFCGLLTLEGIRWTSKSTAERASKVFTPEQLRRLNQVLCEVSCNPDLSGDLGLEKEVDASICLVDSTCLEANIHHPTDWVLLKDVSMTLLKAIKLIRKGGLLNRMPEGPEELARAMNRLCIEMTHARRRKDARKSRKSTLRRMKKLLKKIGEHAQRHRDLLEQNWVHTELSQRQSQRILERIDERLAQLPKVIHQAHERIIGARQVPNQDKILSAHEADVHVIVRGKAGKEVEFGNALFICESADGFITDYHLYKQKPPSERVKLIESLKRQNTFDIERPIEAVVGDRGFDSKATEKALRESGIENIVCPKNIAQLKKRMKEPRFQNLQRRRGSTEARIAILTNNGGRVCRAKGYENRARAIGWGVLAHNFWWVARKVRDQADQQLKAA